jgi:hypothetical protein
VSRGDSSPLRSHAGRVATDVWRSGPVMLLAQLCSLTPWSKAASATSRSLDPPRPRGSAKPTSAASARDRHRRVRDRSPRRPAFIAGPAVVHEHAPPAATAAPAQDVSPDTRGSGWPGSTPSSSSASAHGSRGTDAHTPGPCMCVPDNGRPVVPGARPRETSREAGRHCAHPSPRPRASHHRAG